MFFDRQPVADFARLVSSYNLGEFASPYRSTIPLLSLLKDGEPALVKVLGALGVGSGASLHIEYKTDPTRGVGKPSQTDLMVKAAGAAWAIEAKWTEPRYETVAARVARDLDASNRRDIVQGWLELIQPYALRRLDMTLVESLVYQMVHRAASACGATAKPALVYLVFHTESVGGHPRKDFYRADLTLFHNALGSPAGFPFYLADLGLKPTAAFRAIEALRKGVESTAERVRQALLGERLFEFGIPVVTALRGG